MVRITSLCDNVNNSKRLWSMEGNCVLVEADGLRIVYDVGRDAAIFTHNLGALGLTPAQLDYVVLSHGHHGHVGAMRSEIAFTSAKILYGTGFEVPKFKYRQGVCSPVHNEDLLRTNEALRRNGERVSDHLVLPGGKVYVYKAVSCDPAMRSERFVLGQGAGYAADAFAEELNLCVVTGQGLIVLSGCAHRGVEPIVARAIELTGCARVRALLGGTHINDDEALLAHYCEVVNRYQIALLGPSHCTGILGRAQIARRYRDRYADFSTGKVLEFDE